MLLDMMQGMDLGMGQTMESRGEVGCLLSPPPLEDNHTRCIAAPYRMVPRLSRSGEQWFHLVWSLSHIHQAQMETSRP